MFVHFGENWVSYRYDKLNYTERCYCVQQLLSTVIPSNL